MVTIVALAPNLRSSLLFSEMNCGTETGNEVMLFAVKKEVALFPLHQFLMARQVIELGPETK